MTADDSTPEGATQAPAPADPMTVMAAAAAQVHELFLGYVAAGFTERQALVLIGTMLGQSAGGSSRG